MGLLSKPFKKITHTTLKENNFTKIPWGSPDGRFKNGNPKWKKEHTCYEYYYEDRENYGLYVGLIYYYPEYFKGYVTPFQGNWKNNDNPKHPAGYAYICVDNDNSDWEKIIKIECVEDLNLAKVVLINRIKYLNKKYFK